MATPLRSMTGYGEAERESAEGRVRVEIRTVNHRYLNLQLRLPTGMETLQPALEGALRARFARGHVKVGVSVDAGAGDVRSAIPVDLERARGYRDALRRLQEELGLGGTVDVRLVAGFRDVFQPPEEERTAPEVPAELLTDLVGEAALRVSRMREEEGERLQADLEGRLAVMEREIEAIADRAPERLVAERDRLRARITELLDGQAPVDEDRVAREVAHLAERWDIHEEIVRFRSHIRMFRDTLENGNEEGIGKRLGFIAQEFLREANTIGSKANDAEIAGRVVALKEEIDRVREQVENVE
ncbi:MAG: YicC/YloC family endoribonuclease [Gemmatimonadota bacterium]